MKYKDIIMRHLLLTILLTFVVGICCAQNEHMKFKGIPMEGSLQTFTTKLKAKGYTSIGIQDGVSLLTGEFAGYKDCTIGAVADKSGMICKVTVIFPNMDKWGELERCYSNYKSMLTEKYGEPSICEESFSEGYNGDDANKMYGVQFDKYKYYSVFNSKLGNIQLEISHNSVTSCYVMLSYFDNANQDKLRQQIMDDL